MTHGDRRFIGFGTATLLVVANMVGSGVFTSTGFVVQLVSSPTATLLVWLAGGLIAVCGALVWGSLVRVFPESGGEYIMLSRIYHPALGFIAAMVSFVAAFAASVAGAGLAFAHYLSAVFPSIPPMFVAWLLVVYLSLLHVLRLSMATRTLNLLTVLKVVLIGTFIVAASFCLNTEHWVSSTRPELVSTVMSPNFALGLMIVSYAYSGFNAAAYVAGEVRNPRHITAALVLGTLLVTAMYLALNTVFLMAAPAHKIAGVVQVGHIAAVELFGPRAGDLLSLLIALTLVSTVGAMIMTGPRLYEALGRDYPKVGFLSLRLRDGGPAIATALQAAFATMMIVTFSFESILKYVGFILSVNSALSVAGLWVLRLRFPDRIRAPEVPFYPVTVIAYVATMGWIVYQTLLEDPNVFLAGLVTIAVGYLLYLWVRPESFADPFVEPPGEAR